MFNGCSNSVKSVEEYEKLSSVAQAMRGIGFCGQISDDELAKFDNSKYTEYVQ